MKNLIPILLVSTFLSVGFIGAVYSMIEKKEPSAGALPNGIISVAIFEDVNRKKVHVQIPDSQYEKMMGVGGIDFNPVRNDTNGMSMRFVGAYQYKITDEITDKESFSIRKNFIDNDVKNSFEYIPPSTELFIEKKTITATTT